MRSRGLELVSEGPRPGRGGLLAFEVRPHFGRTNLTTNLILAKRTRGRGARDSASTRENALMPRPCRSGQTTRGRSFHEAERTRRNMRSRSDLTYCGRFIRLQIKSSNFAN